MASTTQARTRPRDPTFTADDAHELNTQETATDQISNAERKYHIWTIGCQMNVADSNHVAARAAITQFFAHLCID